MLCPEPVTDTTERMVGIKLLGIKRTGADENASTIRKLEKPLEEGDSMPSPESDEKVCDVHAV